MLTNHNQCSTFRLPLRFCPWQRSRSGNERPAAIGSCRPRGPGQSLERDGPGLRPRNAARIGQQLKLVDIGNRRYDGASAHESGRQRPTGRQGNQGKWTDQPWFFARPRKKPHRSLIAARFGCCDAERRSAGRILRGRRSPKTGRGPQWRKRRAFGKLERNRGRKLRWMKSLRAVWRRRMQMILLEHHVRTTAVCPALGSN